MFIGCIKISFIFKNPIKIEGKIVDKIENPEILELSVP